MQEPLNELTAAEVARRIARGQLTSEALVAACLERIAAREREVHAWAFLDAGRALEQARALDREPPRSVLHGVPFGIKDVIDTAELPTEYNSPIYRGHQPRWDAACVAQLRQAGCVVLGKTVTTEFANNHPSQTRNPHNLAHTPGGSSSGSAASVADHMAPLALGGIVDYVGRLIGQRLSEAFGQNVVIDNRPGASGIIGIEITSTASGDGYTLLIMDPAIVINPPEVKNGFEKVGADPVGNTPQQAAVFVNNEFRKWAAVIKTANIKAD